MAWYDRLLGRKPVRKRSALEELIERNTASIAKDARTPAYGTAGSNRAFKADILPPVDQNYLEQLSLGAWSMQKYHLLAHIIWHQMITKDIQSVELNRYLTVMDSIWLKKEFVQVQSMHYCY